MLVCNVVIRQGSLTFLTVVQGIVTGSRAAGWASGSRVAATSRSAGTFPSQRQSQAVRTMATKPTVRSGDVFRPPWNHDMSSTDEHSEASTKTSSYDEFENDQAKHVKTVGETGPHHSRQAVANSDDMPAAVQAKRGALVAGLEANIKVIRKTILCDCFWRKI